MAHDTKLADRIRSVLGARAGLTEKAMFGGVAFLLDGRMFCGVVKADLMVRVGPDAHAEALRLGHARPMDFTGRPMKGYVFVGAPGTRTVASVKRWIERGVACARALAVPRKTFRTTLLREGSLSAIPVPFDPKPVFGKARPPVRVTLNGYTFRSTIANMGSGPMLPLRRSNREAAGLDGTETLAVTLELDTEKRTIAASRDLVKALRGAGVEARWKALSYSCQREHVEAIEGAKRPETRARRIEAAVRMVGAR